MPPAKTTSPLPRTPPAWRILHKAPSTITGSTLSSSKPGLPLPPRRKKWAPKSRAGCNTCRQRRIKCDEAKPECNNCTSRQLECAGYIRPPSAGSLMLFLARQPADKPYPLGTEPTTLDMYMFDRMRLDTVTQVHGGIDVEFWTVDVLRATRAYPAIWHAGLALTAMYHRASITGGSETAQLTRQESYVFAIRQYNVSIGHLLSLNDQNQLTHSEREMLLLASVIYGGLCCLVGNTKEAGIHARNGLNLFRQWDLGPRGSIHDKTLRKRRTGVLDTSALVAVLAFAEYQYGTLIGYADDCPSPKLARPISYSNIGADKSVQALEPFQSCKEAYFELQGFLSKTLDMYTPLAATCLHPDSDLRQEYRVHFDIWRARFTVFKQSITFNGLDLENIILLEIYAAAFNIYISADSLATLRQSTQFTFITKLAQQLHDLQTARKHSPLAQPFAIISFSLSVLEILYFVTSNCSDGLIRRKAVDLISSWPRAEGMRGFAMVAAIGRARILAEETRLSAGEYWSEKDEDAEVDGEKCTCVEGAFVCGIHRIVQANVEPVGIGVVDVLICTTGDIVNARKGRRMRVAL